MRSHFHLHVSYEGRGEVNLKPAVSLQNLLTMKV